MGRVIQTTKNQDSNSENNTPLTTRVINSERSTNQPTLPTARVAVEKIDKFTIAENFEQWSIFEANLPLDQAFLRSTPGAVSKLEELYNYIGKLLDKNQILSETPNIKQTSKKTKKSKLQSDL